MDYKEGIGYLQEQKNTGLSKRSRDGHMQKEQEKRS